MALDHSLPTHTHTQSAPARPDRGLRGAALAVGRSYLPGIVNGLQVGPPAQTHHTAVSRSAELRPDRPEPAGSLTSAAAASRTFWVLTRK